MLHNRAALPVSFSDQTHSAKIDSVNAPDFANSYFKAIASGRSKSIWNAALIANKAIDSRKGSARAGHFSKLWRLEARGRGIISCLQMIPFSTMRLVRSKYPYLF
ncbi:hypothetical protein AAG906_034680 [Vitis piasezkii]